MPKVILVMADGSALGRSDYAFEVAPVVGSSIQLRNDGETHFYSVEDVWHAEDPVSHHVRYFAALAKSDAPERWATAEAYLLPSADVDEAQPIEATLQD